MRRLARVPSLSTPGVSWDITLHPDGPACGCPAFDYSREPKTCKHVAIYAAAQHALARCFDAGHEDGTRLCAQCVVDLLAAAAVKVRRRYVPAEVVTEVKAQARAKVAALRERAKARRKRR